MSSINPEGGEASIDENIIVKVKELMSKDHPNMFIVAPSEKHGLIADEMVRLGDEDVCKYEKPEITGFVAKVVSRLISKEEVQSSGWPVVVFGKEFFILGRGQEEEERQNYEKVNSGLEGWEGWKARDWVVFAFDHLFDQIMERESTWGDRPVLDKNSLKHRLTEADDLLDNLKEERRTWISWYGKMVEIFRDSLYEKKIAGLTIVILGAEDLKTEELAGVAHLSRGNPQINAVVLSSKADISLSIEDDKIAPRTFCGLKKDQYLVKKL